MFNDELRPDERTYALMNQRYRNLGHIDNAIVVCDNEAMSPIRSNREMSSHNGYIQPKNTYNVDTGRRPSPAMMPDNTSVNPNTDLIPDDTGTGINPPTNGNRESKKNSRNSATNRKGFPWQGSVTSLFSRLFKIK